LRFAGGRSADRQPWTTATAEANALLNAFNAPVTNLSVVDRIVWQLRRDCYLAITERSGGDVAEQESALVAMLNVNLSDGRQSPR